MKAKQKKILLWLLDIGVNLVIIVILVFVIQKWIIAPFDVSGSSMCNTLNLVNEECQSGYGEKIIINEALYVLGEPERGDIVVFRSPQDDEEKYFIKRIIGLPGDTVEIRNGQVYISKEGSDEQIQLEEPYLSEENKGRTEAFLGGFSVFEVPAGQYFVLGDNRRASRDSRSCFLNSISLSCKDMPEKAYIDKNAIRGKAWVVWWPLKNIRLINHTTYPELNQEESSTSLEEK